jgi:hypothetical protein
MLVAIYLREGLGKFENPIISSRIEPVTLRLIA